MRAVTVCELDLDGEGKLVGEAFCSIKDVFSKEKGRKVSLAKVLQNIPDREVRRTIWNEYFNRLGARPLKEVVHSVREDANHPHRVGVQTVLPSAEV